MKHDGNGHARGSRTKLWAGLTLATIVAASGAVTIANADMRSEHIRPPRSRAFTCSSGFACLQGKSTGSSTHGIYASSTEANAIQAVTTSTTSNSAVAGYSTGFSGTGIGVYGTSNTGPGLYGNSGFGPAVYGSSAAGPGVYGTCTCPESSGVTLAGVYGYGGSNAPGVYAENNSQNYFALVVTEDNPAGNGPLFAGNSSTGGQCSEDNHGDWTCSGTITGGGAERTRQRSASGQTVVAYAPESATATIEDVGTARMSDGVANVQIDPAFASVMDGKGYYIFLTPLGDSRGLYVNTKAANAFQVRESEHGRSNVDFDYRIIGHPRGATYDRLPAAPRMRQLPPAGPMPATRPPAMR